LKDYEEIPKGLAAGDARTIRLQTGIRGRSQSGKMSKREISVAGVAAKWTGRALAGLLLAFWGMFFVEHLSEWFLRADGRTPPAWVWWPMGFHFLMLVGLALMLKWDKAGTLVMIIGTAAFFSTMGWRQFPWIALLNLAPVVLFGLYWLAEWRARRPVTMQDQEDV
jgi:hypothetical protein